MAFLTVTIAGVDRSQYLCAPGAGDPSTFDEALRERKRFSCEFLARTGLYYPQRGQGITVEHSTEGVIFGGYITNATRRKAAGSSAIYTKVTCVSYEQIMSRRRSIARTWIGQIAGGIFNEIVDESLTGEGFTVEFEAGPTIALYDIQDPRPSVKDALDRLCELASNSSDIYYWDVSPAKVVRFFRQDTYPAPFSITDANPYILETLTATVDETNQGIVNRVFVYLGQFLLDEVTETFSGDSTAQSFEVDFPIGETPTITVDVGAGPVTQTLGIDGSDTGKQWYWTPGGTTVRQDVGETILTPTDDLAVTYRGLDRRAVGPFDDNPSWTAEGILQGDGTGLYETFLELGSVGTSTDAETLAQAWLDRYKRATITFKGSTYTAGLRSGQELTVNLTTLGINLVMLIQSVTMSDAGAGRFLWTFTAIQGAARDDWKSALLGTSASTSISGSGSSGVGAQGPPGDPGAPAVPPEDFTIGTLTYRWASVEAAKVLEILIPVTPPTPIGTTAGGHIYVELEDQSSVNTFRLGSSNVGDGDGLVGAWDVRDIAKLPYVATEQPWVIRLEDVSPRRTTVVRVYVEPYSANVDDAPIREGETDETPSALVTVSPYQSGKPSSGVSVTTFLVASITATAADPVNVGGKLRRPISVTVTLPTGTPPDNWAFQLIGYHNGDLDSSPLLATGTFAFDAPLDPLPAGEDGLSSAHTFLPEEPTEITSITIFAVSGLFIPAGVPRGATPGPAEFRPNKIVSGITVESTVSIGTLTGVIDAANLMLESYSAEFHIDPATGKWAMQNVDFSKATNFNTSDFKLEDDELTYNFVDLFKASNFNAAEFEAAGGVFVMKALAADKIKTGILEVGGAVSGGQRVSRFKVFDTATPTPNLIGWVGDDSAASGYVGAWFKRILIGGTSPASAQIIADASGNVAISGALLVSGTVYLGALGPGTLPVGVVYAGTILASQIGSGTLPVGVIYAGAINVSQLTAGTITVATGGSSGTAAITVSGSGGTYGTFIYPGAISLFTPGGSGINAVLHADSGIGTLILANSTNGLLFGVSMFGGTGASAPVLNMAGNRVLTVRQTDPGAASGWTDATAQGWANNLRTALRNHGLI